MLSKGGGACQRGIKRARPFLAVLIRPQTTRFSPHLSLSHFSHFSPTIQAIHYTYNGYFFVFQRVRSHALSTTQTLLYFTDQFSINTYFYIGMTSYFQPNIIMQTCTTFYAKQTPHFLINGYFLLMYHWHLLTSPLITMSNIINNIFGIFMYDSIIWNQILLSIFMILIPNSSLASTKTFK